MRPVKFSFSDFRMVHFSGISDLLEIFEVYSFCVEN